MTLQYPLQHQYTYWPPSRTRYLSPLLEDYQCDHFCVWTDNHASRTDEAIDIYCWWYCGPRASRRVGLAKRLLRIGKDTKEASQSRFVGEEGSWKDVKLARSPLQLRLHVQLSGPQYTDQYVFGSGNDTLGDLHDVIAALMESSFAELEERKHA